ncbi:uncharacterized protein LOC143282430 [Babylonia areolata]|uniref:uncharacterized protein LOC143282430 n=1 Tax=Babylonia areolata TaxID=304850 RepID=UPI003FCFAD43
MLSLSMLSSLLVGVVVVVAVVVDAAGQHNSQALNMYKNKFNGDATYYGGAGGGGACGYGANNPPVAGHTRMTVALNQPQFLGSVMCGSCWKVAGSGQGSGNNPVTGTFTVFVDNLCPECQPGDVDLGVNGDGRWDVSIQAVQCPVGSGKLQFKFQGSNPYYLKLQVRNARIPVHVMEIDHNGWQKMTHTPDGHFVFSGHVSGSFRVRLTAINGAQVIETIPSIVNNQIIHGSHQFPLDHNLPH